MEFSNSFLIMFFYISLYNYPRNQVNYVLVATCGHTSGPYFCIGATWKWLDEVENSFPNKNVCFSLQGFCLFVHRIVIRYISFGVVHFCGICV